MKDKAITKQVVKKATAGMFMIVNTPNNKHIIVMGNYRVSEKEFDTFEDANEYVNSKPYEIILNMVLIHQIYEKEHEKEMANDAQKTV